MSFIRLIVLLLLAVLPALALAQDKSPGSTDPLKPFGCKLAGDVVVVNEEAEFDKAWRALRSLYTTVTNARKNLKGIEEAFQRHCDITKQMMRERIQAGQTLANANLSTRDHNRLVAHYNSLGDNINSR